MTNNLFISNSDNSKGGNTSGLHFPRFLFSSLNFLLLFCEKAAIQVFIRKIGSLKNNLPEPIRSFFYLKESKFLDVYLISESVLSKREVLGSFSLSLSHQGALGGRESSSDGSCSSVSEVGGLAGFALILFSDSISGFLVDDCQIFGDGLSDDLKNIRKKGFIYYSPKNKFLYFFYSSAVFAKTNILSRN